MAEELQGLLIVTLEDGRDVEESKRRVSEIGGVFAVDFNLVTRKLLVRYRGDSAGVRSVESEIKKALASSGDRPHAHGRGKRR